MGLWIPKNREELKTHLSDPLFKNAYFLMFSSLTSAGSGFFFWLIAARFYSTADIGLASAIISAMGLISMLSLLGFDISLVRFLPEREDKQELINSCLTISFIFSLALALIFIAGINIWSPSLSIIRENKILLLLFVAFTAIAPLTALQSQGIFVGFRKAEYSFIQTIVTFARIGIVPFLTAFGALGIYASYGLTPILAFLLGFFLISRVCKYRPFPSVKREVINDLFHFSSGNYIARIFEILPTFVLPIMVINVLGAEKNAYFYIAWQISMLLHAIPRWTSMSLLAEGSYNQEEIVWNARRAMKFILILLAVAIAGIFLFGKYLLWIFGEEYARNSLDVLLILVLGSIPFAFNVVYASVKRVQKEIKPVIWIYASIAVITLVGSYLLARSIGIVGVGIAWVLANVVIASGVGLKVIQR
ncbi:MAG: Membrane protein involved in the export of O-antigen and teichoic acid [Methanophagales archaeon]|nr:oligosaccharide flippase family protein [Methanophagales archaeon]MCU4139669.1 Membrane protein involved in the export of O-antigen and teichoic acid [Methanophagales archaeon]